MFPVLWFLLFLVFPVLTFLPVLILPAVLYLCDSDFDYESLPALTYRLPAPCSVINSETRTIHLLCLHLGLSLSRDQLRNDVFSQEATVGSHYELLQSLMEELHTLAEFHEHLFNTLLGQFCGFPTRQ